MSAVEEAVRRQLALQKPRNNKVTVDPNDDETSPDEDMHQSAVQDAVQTGDVVAGNSQPDEGAFSNLGETNITPKPSDPKIQGRKPHPDPTIEKGLRIVVELDTHNAEHQSEIEKIMSDSNWANNPQHQKEYENRSTEIEQNRRARKALLRNIEGLADAYYQEPTAQSDVPSEPGIGSKVWGGIKSIGKGALDTAKYVGQHPFEAAKDIGHGVQSLASLPERAIGGALPKDSAVGGWLTKKFQTDPETALAKSHEEAGVEKGATGPDVMGAVGEAMLPVGPSIKAGQMLRNVVKGGLTTAGMYTGEKVARKEDITAEGLGGSAAVGGGLSGLLGRFIGKSHPSSAGETGTPDMPPGSGPVEPALKQITNQQKQIGAGPTTEPGGVIYAEGPYKQLPAPAQAEGAIPAGAVEIPISGFNRQFTKVWRTPEGSLIGETRGGEIIRADKQPTSPNVGDPNTPERRPLQQLLDAKRFQRDVTANQAPGAEPPKPSGAGAMPEQPFSGQPKPGLDLTAKPLPTAPQPPSPLQSIIPPKPASQPMQFPAKKPEVLGPREKIYETAESAGSTPLAGMDKNGPYSWADGGKNMKQVNPAPQPVPPQQPSMLKQVLTRSEPQQAPPPAKAQAPITEKAQPQFKPKENSSAKLDISAQKPVTMAKPPGKNIDMLKWAKTEGFEVREFPGTGKVEIRNPLTGEKVTEFNSKDAPSRAKAAEHMQKFQEGDEKGATIKLYSGVDVGEAYKGASKLARELKTRGSALFGEGHDEQTPLLRGLKTGAALERGGGTTGKIVTNANEAERMTHKVVEDLRYEPKEGGGYKETQFELYMRMPEPERKVVDRVVRDFDKLERIPTHEEMVKADHEYLRLTPEQKAAVHGTQEFSQKVHKYMQSEIKERVLMGLGKKTGEFTPRAYKEWLSALPDEERKALEALEVGIGKKEFYYPHKWEGHFEVHEVDPGTGTPTGRKMLKSFEGGREGEGSSSVRTMYQANRLKQQAQVEWGVTPDKLKVVARDQPGASKHLETRKGAAGYEQEKVAETYLDYARSVTHWVEMSKLQRVAGDLLKDPKLSDADKKFLLKYVERVAGKPTAQDMFLNHLMQNIPVLRNALDPYVPFSHVAKGARQFTTATALGVFNAASALVNADGVARHVWPALARLSNELKLPAFSAEKYGASAIKAWTSSTSQTAIDKLGEYSRTKAFAAQLGEALKLNPANKNLLQKMAHEGVLDLQIFGERLPPAEKKSQRAMRGMLAMFAATEDFSRGVASVASYRMARDAGLSETQALQKAFQLTSSALGRYSKAGKPMVYSSELGGTLGIFKTYLHVMMDNAYLNMSHPIKDFGAFSRYALAAIGISGLTGLYPGSQDVDELATKAFGTSPQAWMHKNLPLWVVDGIPTLFGTDLSSRAGAPEVVPNKGEDWLGAVYSKVAKPIATLAQSGVENTLRVAQGEPTSFLQDILPALKSAAPNTVGLRYMLSETEDRLKGSRDRTIIKDLSSSEKAIKAFGLPLNREVQARQQYQVGENLKSKWSEERKRLVDLFLSGDESTKDKWSSLSHKYAITPRMLREEAKRKGKTLTERQKKSMPKSLRRDYEFDQEEF